MAKLTIEEIPGFIFLIDEILEYGEVHEVKNLSKAVLEKGSNAHNKAHERTIRRAFNLRKNLEKGEIYLNDYARPETQAMNIFTIFSSGKKITSFSRYVKKNQEEIDEYYQSHKPSNEIIDVLFKEQSHTKVEQLNEQERTLEQLQEELQNQSLEDFINSLVEQKLVGLLNVKNVEEMKQRFGELLNVEIEKTRKRKRWVASVYRFLGSFFLALIAVPHIEDMKQYVFEKFYLSNQEQFLLHDDAEYNDDDDDDASEDDINN